VEVQISSNEKLMSSRKNLGKQKRDTNISLIHMEANWTDEHTFKLDLRNTTTLSQSRKSGTATAARINANVNLK